MDFNKCINILGAIDEQPSIFGDTIAAAGAQTNANTAETPAETPAAKSPPATLAATTNTTKPDAAATNILGWRLSDDEYEPPYYSDSDAPKVTIQAGDVIEYYTPTLGVAGDRRAFRSAIVTGVRPQESTKLSLSNGEVLPETFLVKKTHFTAEDESGLVEFPGARFRPIEDHELKEGGSGTTADGVMNEAAHFTDIFNKHMASLCAMSGVNGFAPTDVIANVQGGKHMSLPAVGTNRAIGTEGTSKGETYYVLLFFHAHVCF
jgi:hypothetical protein